MSLPKHDPSLAAFLKNLDPSMYSISGGNPTPTSNAVEGLRNDLESRYRETQIRDDAKTSSKYTEFPFKGDPIIIRNRIRLGREEARKEKFRKSPEYKNSPMAITEETQLYLGIAFLGGVFCFLLILFLVLLFR